MKRSQQFRVFTSMPDDGVYFVEAFTEKEGFNPQFTSVEMINFEVLDKDERHHAKNTFFRSDYAVEFLQPRVLKNGPALSHLTGIPLSEEYLEVEYLGHTQVAVISSMPIVRLRTNETIETAPIVINVEYNESRARNYSVIVNGRKFDAGQIRASMKMDNNELVNVDTTFGDYDFQHQVGLVLSLTKQ